VRGIDAKQDWQRNSDLKAHVNDRGGKEKSFVRCQKLKAARLLKVKDEDCNMRKARKPMKLEIKKRRGERITIGGKKKGGGRRTPLAKTMRKTTAPRNSKEKKTG